MKTIFIVDDLMPSGRKLNNIPERQKGKTDTISLLNTKLTEKLIFSMTAVHLLFSTHQKHLSLVYVKMSNF